MHLHRVQPCEFEALYKELEKNFIAAERRDFADAKALLSHPQFAAYHTVENGVRIGFVTLWTLSGMTFAEHFVTYEPFRNKGYGARVLELLKKDFAPLVLEAEPPETELAARRLAFYRRNGFCENAIPYLQPAYRKGEKDVPLVLMSYPHTLQEPAQTVKEIYRVVYERVAP